MLLEREIERVILGGEYGPGDRINEKELALRFGISRGPVREALRTLEATGLVEQVPNRGVFVRQLSAAQADDIYEVRAALSRWQVGCSPPAQPTKRLSGCALS
jgi:DNA-binding GntR family transcriptional regulator